ncbi:MAG TPA: HlyD family efflux transporter periplasmic adaptor subunit [Rhodocyclaceae bacterium]|nr:HlyD family efflux transporter periplasmic adaptor subunit [Rhodocyclaceae bacterium]
MTAPTPDSTPNTARRRSLLAIATACGLAGLAWGGWWFTHGRFLEQTDDAYVAGNVIQITPQVAGTVIAIDADDTQTVRAGQTLVRLDPADARVALEQAEAQLGQSVREVQALYAGGGALEATVRQREADLARARDDLQRRQQVAGSGAVAEEEIEHARAALRAAETALQTAREQLVTNQVQTRGTQIATHPNVQRAAARVEESYLAYARSAVPAPVGGLVARRSVQVGQRVAAGAPLMAVVPLDQVWVDANFKESQLHGMHAGQPVTLAADVYGSRVTYHGHIAGLAAGTGAAFALLPAQNASGNWIKVVQRVPVRIALDPRELAAHPLRIGLSMQVEVDLRDSTDSDAPLAQAVPASPVAATDVYAELGKAARARIQAIIGANSGGPAAPPLAEPVTPGTTPAAAAQATAPRRTQA